MYKGKYKVWFGCVFEVMWYDKNNMWFINYSIIISCFFYVNINRYC